MIVGDEIEPDDVYNAHKIFGKPTVEPKDRPRPATTKKPQMYM